MKTTWPEPLRRGDRIALLSPASIIKSELVTGAVNTLLTWGYEPVVMSNALGHRGTYSGTVAERLDDLTAALTDPTVRAIICTRGGYGAVHLLESLDRLPLESDPKWLVGFSDISALHALMARHGIVSLHASMAKGLARGHDNRLNLLLNDMMQRGVDFAEPTLSGITADGRYNREGRAIGTLRGGNLAVLDGLVGTPFNDFEPGCILIIEDIAEPIYKVERMLYRLKLSGVLDKLAGLVVGQFTEYKPDANYATMEQMIDNVLGRVDYPVVFNAPIGHIDDNVPWFHNAKAVLTVTRERWAVEYCREDS